MGFASSVIFIVFILRISKFFQAAASVAPWLLPLRGDEGEEEEEEEEEEEVGDDDDGDDILSSTTQSTIVPPTLSEKPLHSLLPGEVDDDGSCSFFSGVTVIRTFTLSAMCAASILPQRTT